MGVLKCIVIDDDDFSIKIIEKMIEKTEFLEFSGAYENPVNAIEEIGKVNPDIIFLDVEMPQMTGFDFIGAVGKDKNIIMTTSSEKYALEGYNYDIADYLLKPIIEYSRFLRAVLKVKSKLNGESPLYATNEANSIFIKQDSVFKKILFEEIYWVEAFGDYVKIKSKNGLYTVYSTLSGIEQKLPSNSFVRTHRSFIVNTTMIDKIDQNALQICGESIPIGNSHRKKLLSALNLL